MVSTENSAQTPSIRPELWMNPASHPHPDANEPLPVSGAARTIGSVMRHARRVQGLSLEVLAKQVGCAKSYLSEIENGKRENPPSDELLEKLERALRLTAGDLRSLARLQTMPADLKRELAAAESQRRAARALKLLLKDDGLISPGGGGVGGGGLSINELYRSGALRRLIDQIAPPGDGGRGEGGGKGGAGEGGSTLARLLPVEVPLINSVAAGYPAEFTDLGYPARVADEYVRTPDICDPDSFAARVVGDSMQPLYHEGDIVVFSPAKVVKSGMDCFVRLEPDHDTTFKRVFFEKDLTGSEVVRLQPLNNVYPPRVLPREGVAAAYAAVSVTRAIA